MDLVAGDEGVQQAVGERLVRALVARQQNDPAGDGRRKPPAVRFRDR